MKYCIIRKVSFRLPGTDRTVWANVLCESEGLALLLVPRPDRNQPHSIVLAQENVTERVFESLSTHRFDLESEDMVELGQKLRLLGKSFCEAEFKSRFKLDGFDPTDLF